MPQKDQFSELKSGTKKLLREKIILNSIQRRILLMNCKKEFLAKRQRILEIRTMKLEQFRIDYLPLG